MKIDKTNRGFCIINFTDSYGNKCSLQESSNVNPHIWLGMDDAELKFLDSDGWKSYDLPKEVVSFSRMHLSPEQVAKLLPYLQEFAKTGKLGRKGSVWNKLFRR